MKQNLIGEDNDDINSCNYKYTSSESGFEAIAKRYSVYIWIFLKHMWRHKWSLLVFLIFLINLCEYYELKNSTVSLTTPAPVKNDRKFTIDSFALMNMLQCFDMRCLKNNCYCTNYHLLKWIDANDSCSEILPGYSSLAVELTSSSNFFTDESRSYSISYWIGAYVTQKEICTWTNGKELSCTEKLTSFSKCLFGKNKQVHLGHCSVNYNEYKNMYGICSGRTQTKTYLCSQHKCNNQICYCVLKYRKYSWKAADKACRTAGFDGLVVFSNADEQKFVLEIDPSLSLMIGATTLNSSHVHWFNSKQGLQVRDINFAEDQQVACYIASVIYRKVDYHFQKSCNERMRYICQIPVNTLSKNRKTVSVDRINHFKSAMKISKCSSYFCKMKLQKCYCVTQNYVPWRDCAYLLGKPWKLATFKTSDDYDYVMGRFYNTYFQRLWVGCTEFVSKGKLRWIDGSGLPINTTIGYSGPYCANTCKRSKICLSNCHSSNYKSLCSINTEDILNELNV